MSLPRKGSRTLTVDDDAYRWMLSPRHGSGMAILVERAEATGQRLVASVEHGVKVTPAVVRTAIDEGRRLGWTPTERRPELLLDLRGRWSPTEASAQCPCCDYFSLPRRADYDICPVCGWEDHGLDLDRPDTVSSPNHTTLRAARAVYARHGACHEASVGSGMGREEAERRFARRPRTLEDAGVEGAAAED